MASYSCSQNRSEAPSRLAGELNALEQDRFDAHQLACPHCRALLESLSGALALGRAEPAPLSLEQRDAEYAALVARLKRDGGLGAQAARAAVTSAPRRVKTWAWVTAGGTLLAAAAVLLVVYVGTSDAGRARQAEGVVSVILRPGLDLRVTPGTEWRLVETGPRTTLSLSRGSVYVRLAPLTHGRSFAVRAPGLAVRVVGTVFVVRSDGSGPTEVAVMRGRVMVEPDGLAASLLVAGRAWRGTRGAGAASASDYGRVRDWLAEESPSSPPSAAAAQGSRAPSAEPVAEPPSEALRPPREAALAARTTTLGVAPTPAAPASTTYADAERALREQGPARAAELLEAIVRDGPDGPDADTARLELGTLYAGPLLRPADARRHLTALLARHRSGAGVTAARRLLCRVEPLNDACITEPGPGDQRSTTASVEGP